MESLVKRIEDNYNNKKVRNFYQKIKRESQEK